MRPFKAAARGGGEEENQSEKRGMQAFRAMLKHLKNGEMVLATADVPPGPVFETGPGMVKLAAKSGADYANWRQFQPRIADCRHMGQIEVTAAFRQPIAGLWQSALH